MAGLYFRKLKLISYIYSCIPCGMDRTIASSGLCLAIILHSGFYLLLLTSSCCLFVHIVAAVIALQTEPAIIYYVGSSVVENNRFHLSCENCSKYPWVSHCLVPRPPPRFFFMAVRYMQSLGGTRLGITTLSVSISLGCIGPMR